MASAVVVVVVVVVVGRWGWRKGAKASTTELVETRRTAKAAEKKCIFKVGCRCFKCLVVVSRGGAVDRLGK